MEDVDRTGKLVVRCDDCHDAMTYDETYRCDHCGKDLCPNCKRMDKRLGFMCETCEDCLHTAEDNQQLLNDHAAEQMEDYMYNHKTGQPLGAMSNHGRDAFFRRVTCPAMNTYVWAMVRLYAPRSETLY